MISNSAALKHLKKDNTLSPLLERIVLHEYEGANSCYEALIKSIVSQQLSVKAAASIYGRLLKLTKKPITKPAILGLRHDELRTVGLSNSKANYVKNVASFFTDKKLNDQQFRQLSNEEIINLLTEIKGVGVWTVQMMLMFHLNRPDVFPIGDLEIRKQMIALYDVRSEGKKLYADLEAIASKWRPYRTVACRYLWANF